MSGLLNAVSEHDDADTITAHVLWEMRRFAGLQKRFDDLTDDSNGKTPLTPAPGGAGNIPLHFSWWRPYHLVPTKPGCGAFAPAGTVNGYLEKAAHGC